MRNEWSSKWLGSAQPRKQRKWRANAPLHARHKLLAAPLSKELRQQLRIRRLPVRKGDEVEILRGKFRKARGDVERVDLRTAKIYVSTAKIKKASGAEVQRPIDPSKVRITKLNLEDKERKAALQRAARRAPAAPAQTPAVKGAAAKPAATAPVQTPRGKGAAATPATKAAKEGS